MLETECLKSALIPCSRERLRLSNHAANASVSNVRCNEMGLDHTRKGRLYLVFSFQASQGNHDVCAIYIDDPMQADQPNLCYNKEEQCNLQLGITSLPVPLPSNMARKVPICVLALCTLFFVIAIRTVTSRWILLHNGKWSMSRLIGTLPSSSSFQELLPFTMLVSESTASIVVFTYSSITVRGWFAPLESAR